MLIRKEEKKTWIPTMMRAAASIASRSSDRAPKPRSAQITPITTARTSPGAGDRAAEQQPVLEAETAPLALEPGMLHAHEVGAVGLRAQPKREHLRPYDHQQRSGDHRVQVPLAPEQLEPREDCERDQHAEQRHHGAGHDEQPGGAVDQQEAQVAPAIPVARELRLALARVVADRDLGDHEAFLACSDHHLGGELHARCAQLKRRQRERRTARIPQWASRTPVRKKRLRSPVSSGLPT